MAVAVAVAAVSAAAAVAVVMVMVLPPPPMTLQVTLVALVALLLALALVRLTQVVRFKVKVRVRVAWQEAPGARGQAPALSGACSPHRACFRGADKGRPMKPAASRVRTSRIWRWWCHVDPWRLSTPTRPAIRAQPRDRMVCRTEPAEAGQ